MNRVKNKSQISTSFAIFSISLLSIIDLILLILILIYPKYQFASLGIHIFLYAFFKVLTNTYLKEYEGVPNYIFLFMFGLGGIIVSIIYFSLDYFLRDSMILDDYERYINYEELMSKRLSIDYEKEVKTISLLDQMKLMDVETKKQLILNFNSDKSSNKLKFLKIGLNDKDIEVQHYSAVMLNMLENELSEAINQLRRDYNTTREINLLFKMAIVYKEYIDSELLTGKVLEAFNSEYIEVLNKICEAKKETPEIIDELVKAYLRSKNFTRAEEINEKVLETWPTSLEANLNKLRIAYERKEFFKLQDLIDNIPINTEEIPNRYTNLIEYWTRREGE
ncbi:hypothetical protein CLHOM_08100 [Clostridium homopropionicum DSM 5847]|uniref:Uncharacterized protein n=1 Tax=Clostridium homopropionicum DSM 5847 TaxID=1121318 RepID=A0A0L6ZCZ1_9CLOT|nr:hypothetical protein [Clostridium homopropionicum]KOA20668.1 hypothetical protein CLHOM_08100 [Clostridium homopropionicum DSM 5847]SFF91886.1 hypothetical protein SAMN04488501_103192 [Clostridium homopropionicum]